MNESIRTFLQGVARKHGWPTSPEDLLEILTNARVVWTGNECERRHWIDFDQVVEVDGRFFRFGWAKGAGDQGVYDAGWKFDWESIIEVEPVKKIVTVTRYLPVKDKEGEG